MFNDKGPLGNIINKVMSEKEVMSEKDFTAPNQLEEVR
jgi:hypothetical protein